jgi:hypothetical protein
LIHQRLPLIILMITQDKPMSKQGILFVSSYTRHRPLANAACLVAGAIVTSLAFHPTVKAGTPITGDFPSAKLKVHERYLVKQLHGRLAALDFILHTANQVN